jgi:phage repressor protein C with HTH and peptisase S24 domain
MLIFQIGRLQGKVFMNLQIDFSKGSVETLDRILEAYGFKTKLALADHLGIASSSLANRDRRGFVPADIVVRCMAETGATLEWLATGQGRKFYDEELDMMHLHRQKLADGQLIDAGMARLDKVFFKSGSVLPTDPVCIQDDKAQYIVDRSFTEVFDGEWLVSIEGKISIRTLVRIPTNRVRVGGVGMSFDCSLDEISVLGRVVMTITN